MSKAIGILRNDGLGDLILTLPLVLATRLSFPDCTIFLIVNPKVVGLSKIVSIEGVSWVPLDRKRPFFETFKRLRSMRLHTLMAVYAPFPTSLASFFLKIPVRVGYAYKPSGFLFNNKVSVHRSHPPVHESKFALAFLERLGVYPEASPRELFDALPVTISESQKNGANAFFETLEASRPLVGIHPGFGGSALNWPLGSYAELLRRLTETGKVTPILTGSALEGELLDTILAQSGTPTPKLIGLELPEFAAAMKSFSVLVAPSTGVLHLASLLGVKTIGLFSPLLAHSPLKWAPLRKGKVFVPPIQESLKASRMRRLSPDKKDLLMSGIGVDEVVCAVLEAITADNEGF